MTFQFQIGAIKSDKHPVSVKVGRFQFQIGAIKSESLPPRYISRARFQFQIGAIKR